ncbi:hypothetical protein D3C80_1680450 [compost metagenome]
MSIDKHTLRSKARSASASEWIKESGEGWEAICCSDDQANGGFTIAHFEGADAQANREFVQVANPDAMLALLDELEAAYARNAKQEKWIKDIEESMIAATDRAEAAEKRIAELEAREVKLPKPISVLHRRDFIDAHRSIYAYPEAEVNAALADAGIRIHGED